MGKPLVFNAPELFEKLVKHAGHKPYVRYWCSLNHTWSGFRKAELYCPKCKETLIEIYEEGKSNGKK